MSNWTPEVQPFGPNRAPLLAGLASDGSDVAVPVAVDPATGRLLVNATGGSAATSVAINDGVTTSLKASVLSLTDSHPLTTAIVDGNGDQITSFGGGTQYTDAGTPPAHPVGPTLEFNNAGAWATVGSATPLPITIAGGLSNPLPVSAASSAGVASANWTWTTATTLNTTQQLINNTFGYSTAILQYNPNASVATGKVTIEGSIDGTNYNPLNVQQINGETGLYPFNGTELALPASTPIIFQIAIGGVNYVRVRLSTVITGGGGSVAFFANLTTSANFGATSEQGVSLIAPQSGQAANINSGGALYTSVILSGTSAPLDDTANFGDGLSSGVAAVGNRLYNGSTYDRWRGDATNGGWVNIKAGTVGTTTAAVNVAQQTVNTSAVQLSASATTPTNGILVEALSTNSASLFIGGSGVTTSNGWELQPGQSVPFTCVLNTLYIISAASTTDKVCYNVT